MKCFEARSEFPQHEIAHTPHFGTLTFPRQLAAPAPSEKRQSAHDKAKAANDQNQGPK